MSGLIRTLALSAVVLGTSSCDFLTEVLESSNELSYCTATLFTRDESQPRPILEEERVGFFNLYVGRFENKSWVGEDARLPPGFSHVGRSVGGVGRELWMLGCDDGVYFRHTWERLRVIAVSEGWTGSTDDGVRIGTTIDELKAIHSLEGPVHIKDQEIYSTERANYWIKDEQVAGIETRNAERISRVGPNIGPVWE